MSTRDWMVETQLCKLSDISDTFVGRAYHIPGTSKYFIYNIISCLWTKPTIWLLTFSSTSFTEGRPRIFIKKLKNVSWEYDRLNGWNSTLQAAWYIRHVRWVCLFYISFMIRCLWTKPTKWLLILSFTNLTEVRKKNEKRQLWVRPIEWLKLNFASCVVYISDTFVWGAYCTFIFYKIYQVRTSSKRRRSQDVRLRTVRSRVRSSPSFP